MMMMSFGGDDDDDDESLGHLGPESSKMHRTLTGHLLGHSLTRPGVRDHLGPESGRRTESHLYIFIDRW